MNLQTIADELNVSRSTVSRALRGDERISPLTRQKVSETAKRLGYRSNPYLSILMANLREGALPNASPVIAFLNPYADHDSFHTKKTFSDTFRGAALRARELGFELEEFFLGQRNMTGARLRGILSARNIRAVVLCRSGNEDPGKYFDASGFAAVNIAANAVESEMHCVAPDFLGNTFKAIQALRHLGYHRIGLALETGELERMRGLPRMAFLEHEHSLRPSQRIGFWIGHSNDLSGFAKWLLDRQPDAIVTSDLLPQKWLQPLGLQIPSEVGVAQLDPLFSPFGYSGIDGRFEQIGAAAIDFLIAKIATSEFESHKFGDLLLTAGEWRPGWSTRDKTGDRLATRYSEPVLELLAKAASGPRDALGAARREVATQHERRPFALAAFAPAAAWKHLSLRSVANSAFKVRAYPPSCPAPLSLPPFAGRHLIRGVPFLPNEKPARGEFTCIALDSVNKMRQARPLQIPVAEKLSVRAVYICHFSFYGWSADTAAGAYEFQFADGSVDAVELRAYNPPSSPMSVATFQDSWPAHPQFERPSCKHFLLQSEEHPFLEDRYGYVLEYRVPDERSLEAIEFCVNPKSDMVTLIPAITLLLDL